MSPDTKKKLVGLLWAACLAGLTAFVTALANGIGGLDLSPTEAGISGAAGAAGYALKMLA